jgi:GT2 family glycosyltransferase
MERSMTRQDGVSIITCTHLPRYMNNIFDNYARQTYPDKELILILNSSYLNPADWYKKAQAYKNVKIIQRPEYESVGTCLNYAVKEITYPYFSIFDHDDYYGEDYLNDFMAVAPFSSTLVFGKKTHYVYFEDQKTLALIHPGKENSYVNYIINCTLFGKKEIFKKVKFIDSNVVDEQFGEDCTRLGIKIYAIHPYNFAYIRHDDLRLHTYKLENYQLLQQYCDFVAQVDDYRPWVDRKKH